MNIPIAEDRTQKSNLILHITNSLIEESQIVLLYKYMEDMKIKLGVMNANKAKITDADLILYFDWFEKIVAINEDYASNNYALLDALKINDINKNNSVIFLDCPINYKKLRKKKNL
jgi:hypothetical protein